MSADSKPTSRRTFLKSTAIGGGGAGRDRNRAPAVLAGTRARDKVTACAMIGVGTQGHGLINAVQSVPGTEIRVICDLYDGNIKRAQGLCSEPGRADRQGVGEGGRGQGHRRGHHRDARLLARAA